MLNPRYLIPLLLVAGCQPASTGMIFDGRPVSLNDQRSGKQELHAFEKDWLQGQKIPAWQPKTPYAAYEASFLKQFAQKGPSPWARDLAWAVPVSTLRDRASILKGQQEIRRVIDSLTSEQKAAADLLAEHRRRLPDDPGLQSLEEVGRTKNERLALFQGVALADQKLLPFAQDHQPIVDLATKHITWPTEFKSEGNALCEDLEFKEGRLDGTMAELAKSSHRPFTPTSWD